MTTTPDAKAESRYRILDAVISQDGEKFVRYGNDDQNAWLSVDAVNQSPADVFKTLSRSGIHILASRSREHFKSSIESRDEYTSALVGSCSGWLAKGVHLKGDGALIVSDRIKPPEVIVALTPDSRFGTLGTLEAWKAANAPFIQGQPLVQIVYAYALVGYLMSFAPPDFQNPVLEIVGETEMGKTSLAIGAGSVCGGNPSSGTGYGLSWDRTNGTLDKLGRQFRENLLVLNENNLTGADAAAQAETMRTAVMKFTEPGERETMLSAGSPVYPRLALLSTSNMSIGELISGSGKTDAAIRTRVLTLLANRPFGIFDAVPDGYVDASDAVRAIVGTAAQIYGICGKEFLVFLGDYRRSAITRVIERSFKWVKNSDFAESFHERQLKTLALIRAAAILARKADVMPAEIGSIGHAMRSVLNAGSRPAAPRVRTARDAVINYLRRHKDDLLDSALLKQPLPKDEFERSPGCWIENGECVLIPTVRFKTIAGSGHVLKSLNRDGILEAEDHRHTKKVPSVVCDPCENCRGHFIRICRREI